MMRRKAEEIISRADGAESARATKKTAVPRLRFKGCEGAWGAEPFAKFVERRTVAADDDRLPCVEYEDIVSGEGRLNDVFPKKQTHKKGLLFEPDDVLFGKLRPYLRNQLRAEFKGIAAGDFWVLRGMLVCGKFLYALTESEMFQAVANISCGSKMPRSDWNLVSTSKFSYPSDFGEQNKIGKGFQTIDAVMSLLESHLSSLRQLKRAMLVKMFPRPGQSVPEIRFKGFEGEWEEKAVSELVTERVCIGTASPEWPLMAFVSKIGITDKGERYDRTALMKDAAAKKYKRTQMGDFIYSSNNLDTGSIGLNRFGNASISPVYSIFQCLEKADSDFVGSCFIRKEFVDEMVKWRQGVVYGQWRIHEADFLKIVTKVPSLPEQRKIAAFFRNLDRLIGAAEKKVAKLRQVKASLLERMFV